MSYQIVEAVMEGPFWPVCRSEAYHFLLIELALVPSLRLCHLKPVCLLTDGMSPLSHKRTEVGKQAKLENTGTSW